MDYQGKIRTLFPNRTNITNDEQVPIPIETAFFLEDSTPDSTKLNRYYFNFPAEWCTSNRGETIIGVRNIFTMPRRRKLEYNIGIRKYFRNDYNKIAKAHPEYGLDLIYDEIDPDRKSETSFNVVSWLPSDKDLREVFKDLNDSASAKFKIVNEEINIVNQKYHDKFKAEYEQLSEQSTALTGEKEALEKEIDELQEQYDSTSDITEKERIMNMIGEKSSDAQTKKEAIIQLTKQMDELSIKIKEDYKPTFQQEIDELRRRDIQMDGIYSYERNCFIEMIESPKNKEPKDRLDELDQNEYKYYVDLKINFDIGLLIKVHYKMNHMILQM